MPDLVIEARSAAISKAVMVNHILTFHLRRMVGPFIFTDLGILFLPAKNVLNKQKMIGTLLSTDSKKSIKHNPTYWSCCFLENFPAVWAGIVPFIK